MDLSEEFEEFLKKSAILKSSGAELQIANRSHDRSYFNRSGTQRTVQNRCQPLPMAAVLAAVARYSTDR